MELWPLVYGLSLYRKYFLAGYNACLQCFDLRPVFLMFLHLFIAALWSPAGKGLISWLLLVMFVVLLLLSHVLSQGWYLIAWFPDLCHLSYFN